MLRVGVKTAPWMGSATRFPLPPPLESPRQQLLVSGQRRKNSADGLLELHDHSGILDNAL